MFSLSLFPLLYLIRSDDTCTAHLLISGRFPLRDRYDIAVLYLQQANYDLEMAIEAFKADEQWETDHPMEANVKGKGKAQDKGRRRLGGVGLTGQLS